MPSELPAIVTTTAGKILNSLPAQFLVLVLINAVFVVGLLWFLNQQEMVRERTFAPLVKACIGEVPAELLKDALARGRPP